MQLGFRNSFGVNSRGQSRGLGLFWNGDINLRILSISERYIDSEIRGIGNGRHWCFTGFYGDPVMENRSQSWDLMRRLASGNSLPWLIEGDFNELFGIHEKVGGPIRPINQILEFRRAICDC